MKKELLRTTLNESLSQDDLESIIFDLDVPGDDFPAGKNSKIRALISYLDQRKQLELLSAWLTKNRADIDLHDILETSDPVENNAATNSNSHQVSPIQPAKENLLSNFSGHNWIATIAAIFGIIVLLFGCFGITQFSDLLSVFENEEPTPILKPTSTVNATLLPPPDSLIFIPRQWQGSWNNVLVVLNIPDRPNLGETAGTIGYLYDDEQYHCGFDLWYAGEQNGAHKFVPLDEYGPFATILDEELANCHLFDIEPFEFYQVTIENGELHVTQVVDEVDQKIVLKEVR